MKLPVFQNELNDVLTLTRCVLKTESEEVQKVWKLHDVNQISVELLQKINVCWHVSLKEWYVESGNFIFNLKRVVEFHCTSNVGETLTENEVDYLIKASVHCFDKNIGFTSFTAFNLSVFDSDFSEQEQVKVLKKLNDFLGISRKFLIFKLIS